MNATNNVSVTCNYVIKNQLCMRCLESDTVDLLNNRQVTTRIKSKIQIVVAFSNDIMKKNHPFTCMVTECYVEKKDPGD